MRSVPRNLLEKVIKKSVAEGNCRQISGHKVFYPLSPFERGCFEAMGDVAKVSTVKELQSALDNAKVSEIFVSRDDELNARNLTNILENSPGSKTVYCSFNLPE